jgi:hypothetical protein
MGIASFLRLTVLFELIVFLLTNPKAREVVITEIHIDRPMDDLTNIYREPIRCEQGRSCARAGVSQRQMQQSPYTPGLPAHVHIDIVTVWICSPMC